jgi:hypothetical protein
MIKPVSKLAAKPTRPTLRILEDMVLYLILKKLNRFDHE